MYSVKFRQTLNISALTYELDSTYLLNILFAFIVYAQKLVLSLWFQSYLTICIHLVLYVLCYIKKSSRVNVTVVSFPTRVDGIFNIFISSLWQRDRAALSSVTQLAMHRGIRKKVGNEAKTNNRFPPPNLLHAGYSVKLKNIFKKICT